MTPDPDLYALLGVPADADSDAIKKAYRRLARQLHPDVNPDPATQEKFKEVSRAYEILSDPQKRAVYDRGGDAFPGGGGFGQGFSFTDIMDAFFGGQAPGGQGRGPRPRVHRGQDAHLFSFCANSWSKSGSRLRQYCLAGLAGLAKWYCL